MKLFITDSTSSAARAVRIKRMGKRKRRINLARRKRRPRRFQENGEAGADLRVAPGSGGADLPVTEGLPRCGLRERVSKVQEPRCFGNLRFFSPCPGGYGAGKALPRSVRGESIHSHPVRRYSSGRRGPDRVNGE